MGNANTYVFLIILIEINKYGMNKCFILVKCVVAF